MPGFCRLILLATVLAPVASGAQVTIGVVVAGVSSTASVTPDLPNKESRMGYAAGVSLSVPLANAIHFAPELLYTVKGVKATVVNTQGSGTADVRLTSIEVPLLLRWSPAGVARVRPSISAGPSISFNQKCSNLVTVKVGAATASKERMSCADATSDGTTSVDYGAMFGAGLTVSKLSVSLRYDLGLKNVRKNPAAGEDVKNRAILLALGISR